MMSKHQFGPGRRNPEDQVTHVCLDTGLHRYDEKPAAWTRHRTGTPVPPTSDNTRLLWTEAGPDGVEIVDYHRW